VRLILGPSLCLGIPTLAVTILALREYAALVPGVIWLEIREVIALTNFFVPLSRALKSVRTGNTFLHLLHSLKDLVCDSREKLKGGASSVKSERREWKGGRNDESDVEQGPYGILRGYEMEA
jgi:hypothetical protein